MRYLVRSTALSLLLLGSAVEAATVTLTWTAPTLRSDNTTALPATQIAGADVYDDFACAMAPCANPNGIIIGSVTGALGTFKTPQLAPGKHDFAVVTRDTSTPSVSSAASNTFTATIVILPPAAITNLTGTIGP